LTGRRAPLEAKPVEAQRRDAAEEELWMGGGQSSLGPPVVDHDPSVRRKRPRSIGKDHAGGWMMPLQRKTIMNHLVPTPVGPQRYQELLDAIDHLAEEFHKVGDLCPHFLLQRICPEGLLSPAEWD